MCAYHSLQNLVSCYWQISNSGNTAPVWLWERKMRHVRVYECVCQGGGRQKLRLVLHRWQWEDFPKLCVCVWVCVSMLLRGLQHAQTFSDDSSAINYSSYSCGYNTEAGELWRRNSPGSVSGGCMQGGMKVFWPSARQKKKRVILTGSKSSEILQSTCSCHTSTTILQIFNNDTTLVLQISSQYWESLPFYNNTYPADARRNLQTSSLRL